MDTVQKMERYVERSRVFDHGHGMTQTEWVALIAQAEGGTNNICQAVSLAFNYGRAKGYGKPSAAFAPRKGEGNPCRTKRKRPARRQPYKAQAR